jgi:hypothetical protein
MAKSGIAHADVGDELSKAEWLDEENHELVHGNSLPGSPTERQLFYRDDEHKWYIYNGSAWKEVTAEGVSTFLALTDTPSSYSGQAGKYAKVNTGETALEFATPGGGGDMLKSVYDTGDNGIVDNSEKLEGSTKAEVQDHNPKAHSLAGAQHTADTLANLNAKVSDATLDGSGASRTPTAHKTSHENGGSDEISIEGLDGSPAQKAAASGLASLNASSKVLQQPESITDHLQGTPGEGVYDKACNANWAYDHVNDKDAHHSNVITITFIIDGGGSAITTGEKGHLEVPFACTITQVTMLADQSGSIVVDIWKDTYANFPPTDADSITASAPPTLSSAQKAQDSTLTGWTTSISAGDILAFNVDSCTTITRVTISLKVEKS